MTVSTMGMTKHRISGKSVNNNHFTGKKKSKSKRKQALTKKEKIVEDILMLINMKI